MIMNYLYTKNQFDVQKIPNFTLELVYNNRTPELPNAFHVSSNSFMFHKENLYRILETKIPKKYKKLAFLDCDLLFQDPTWYEKTSKLLDDYDVVQPFETAYWLDLTYSSATLQRDSIVKLHSPQWNFEYHPGFAWCMRRDWYIQTGFFDYAISGSGDTLSSAAWLRKVFPKNFQSLPKSIESEYTTFKKQKSPRITYLKGYTVHHLYHGSRVNRNYSERHKMINVQTDIHKLIVKNKDGVFEWKNPSEWNILFLKYFKGRNDDDLSEIVPIIQTTLTT
jgi:hypothetical protein